MIVVYSLIDLVDLHLKLIINLLLIYLVMMLKNIKIILLKIHLMSCQMVSIRSSILTFLNVIYDKKDETYKTQVSIVEDNLYNLKNNDENISVTIDDGVLIDLAIKMITDVKNLANRFKKIFR